MKRLTYSVPEAAEALGVSDWLVYRLIRRGELPALRLGERRTVVPIRALHEFLTVATSPSSVPPASPARQGRDTRTGGGDIGVAETEPASPPGASVTHPPELTDADGHPPSAA